MKGFDNAYPTRKHRFGQPERMVVNVLAARKDERFPAIYRRPAAQTITSNPTLWNEPLRSQLVLASLDGLISYAAKVHYQREGKRHERYFGV